jgi:excisionase family DNA binding protein
MHEATATPDSWLGFDELLRLFKIRFTLVSVMNWGLDMLVLAESNGQVSLAATPAERVQARDLIAADWEGELAVLSGGQRVRIPPELSRMLRRVVEVVAKGEGVFIGGVPAELTTTEAAKQLGVSRPTLMKLISSGGLPAHQVGAHHRIRTEDLAALKRTRLEAQRQAFNELIELESELEAHADK